MPAIIMALVTALVGAARQYLPGIVGRLLLALGIGLAADQLVLPTLNGMIQSQLSGMPSVVYAYAGALGIDKAATMILSALAARASQKVLLKKLSNT